MFCGNTIIKKKQLDGGNEPSLRLAGVKGIDMWTEKIFLEYN